MLRDLQAQQRADLKARRDLTWVFRSREGTPMEETTLSRAWRRLQPLAAKQGVRPLPLHSLRHTFATLSLQAGKPLKWVASQLGHRDASVTLNDYAHAMPEDAADLSYLPILAPSLDGAETAPAIHRTAE